uniref:Uncharacterized protein n=1 Tax=Rhizophora mucronata TaxID=61149 RepID=A0A2P2PTD0_RHIMU
MKSITSITYAKSLLTSFPSAKTNRDGVMMVWSSTKLACVGKFTYVVVFSMI